MATSTDDQNKLTIFIPVSFKKKGKKFNFAPFKSCTRKKRRKGVEEGNIGESDVFFSPGNGYYLQQYKQHTKRGNFYSPYPLSPPIIFYPFLLIKQSLPFRVTKLLQIIYIIYLTLWTANILSQLFIRLSTSDFA